MTHSHNHPFWHQERSIILFIKDKETLQALNVNDNNYYNRSNNYLCFTWSNGLLCLEWTCESRRLPPLNVSMMWSHIKAKQLYETVAVNLIQGQCEALTAKHKMNKHRRPTGELHRPPWSSAAAELIDIQYGLQEQTNWKHLDCLVIQTNTQLTGNILRTFRQWSFKAEHAFFQQH